MEAFRFSFHYNDSYAFREHPRLTKNQMAHQELVADMSGAVHAGPKRCPVCQGLIAKWDEPLANLKIKKRRLDISITYDGISVGSQRFKTLYAENRLNGLVFRALPNDPDFFQILATRKVGFDVERANIRFVKECPDCGRYQEVFGVRQICLKPGPEVDNREFVRTDLEFGYRDAQAPIFLCGMETAHVFQIAKLHGLELTAFE